MKKKSLLLIASAFTLFSAFAKTNPVDETKVINTEKSSINWKAYKVTGSHYGTINLTSGSLNFTDGKLNGGSFEVNMTTLTSTDLEGEWKDKLNGHLKSEDFFSVEKHQSSSLIFTEVKASGKNSYQVTGNLTIKGITKPVTFELAVYGSKANATLKVDRAQYDIRYGSGSFFDNLGDKTIYDEFDLVVDLEWDAAS
jgi:polyisoprenoid-binding protein YceI